MSFFYKAFQHFFHGLQKSVTRLRSKKYIGKKKLSLRGLLHLMCEDEDLELMCLEII